MNEPAFRKLEQEISLEPLQVRLPASIASSKRASTGCFAAWSRWIAENLPAPLWCAPAVYPRLIPQTSHCRAGPSECTTKSAPSGHLRRAGEEERRGKIEPSRTFRNPISPAPGETGSEMSLPRPPARRSLWRAGIAISRELQWRTGRGDHRRCAARARCRPRRRRESLQTKSLCPPHFAA